VGFGAKPQSLFEDALMTASIPIDGSEPLVLRGAARDWPAFAWTFASLRDRAGDARVPIHTGRWKQARFLVERDGRTEKGRAAAFLDDMVHGRASGYLAGYELFREVPSLRADLAFPDVGFISADIVWIGPAGTSTPIHFDRVQNLYAQLRGQKRWRIWRPERKLRPELWGFGGYAMSALDAGRGPEAAGPPDIDWVLDTGDLLFLPKRWWHRVDTLSDSISVNRWWRLGPLRRLFRRGG